MEQNTAYIRVSELVQMARRSSPARQSKCDFTLGLIEQTLHEIDDMSISERETFIKRLHGYILVKKFEGKAQAALIGLQRYAVATCLLDNPSWVFAFRTRWR